MKCSVHNRTSVVMPLQLLVGSGIAIGCVVHWWNWIPCALKFLHNNGLKLRKKDGKYLSWFLVEPS